MLCLTLDSYRTHILIIGPIQSVIYIESIQCSKQAKIEVENA